MNDIIFYDDGRKADKRIFVEYPKGTKTDICTKEGEYLFSCNRHPVRVKAYCMENQLPTCWTATKCGKDDRKPELYKTKRPGRYLTQEEVKKILKLVFGKAIRAIKAEGKD